MSRRNTPSNSCSDYSYYKAGKKLHKTHDNEKNIYKTMGNTVPDNLIHPTVKYEDHCPRYIHAGRQKLPSNTPHYGRHCSR